jgi:dTDP-D-glucose 4,6-dehydratase
VRSYLYVEDVAEAFDTVLHKGEVGETYNIGTEKERSVMDVAHDIAAVFKLPTSNIVHVKDRAFNDRCARRCCAGLWRSGGARSGGRGGGRAGLGGLGLR